MVNQGAKIEHVARLALWRTPALDDLERFLSHEPAFALHPGIDRSGPSALENV
jgi:hypothetical protein